jgi:hypothetical protein
MVFDFWVAIRDLDQGSKADFSARLRFQSIDRRLTLNCPKVEAVPLADWLVAHGATHVCVATQCCIFAAETSFMKSSSHDYRASIPAA